jgi:hypothetical protein
LEQSEYRFAPWHRRRQPRRRAPAGPREFRLATEASDWLAAGQVENPAGDEINTVWTFRRPIDGLLFVPAAYGGLLCLKPSTLRRFDTMLSPALRSVMRAMPDLFEDR